MKKLTIIIYPDGDKSGNDLLKSLLAKYNLYQYQEFTGNVYGQFMEFFKRNEIRPRMKILVFKKVGMQDLFDLIPLVEMTKIPVTLDGGARSFIAPDFIITSNTLNSDLCRIYCKQRMKDIDITFIDITKLKLK